MSKCVTSTYKCFKCDVDNPCILKMELPAYYPVKCPIPSTRHEDILAEWQLEMSDIEKITKELENDCNR